MLVFKPLQTFQALSVIVCLGQNKMKNYLFILSRKCQMYSKHEQKQNYILFPI